jgi:hypothetical protein
VNGTAECVQLVLPQPETCADGLDNDCDGFIDGVDPDCEKLEICHVPPGNRRKVKLITVGADAVPAHLEHGDYFPEAPGSCEREDKREEKQERQGKKGKRTEGERNER